MDQGILDLSWQAETRQTNKGKLRTAALEFVTALPWTDPYAVTLTLKTGYFSDAASKRDWIKLDSIKASQNLRHFLNRLGRISFSKSELRKGAELRCVAVLEDCRALPHLHLCLDRPQKLSQEELRATVVQLWHRTRFGNLEVDVERCFNVNGWLGYMAKYRTKTEYSDSIDWLNFKAGSAV